MNSSGVVEPRDKVLSCGSLATVTIAVSEHVWEGK